MIKEPLYSAYLDNLFFEKVTDPCVPKLSPDITGIESISYGYGWITPENIYALSGLSLANNYSDYDPLASYLVGDIVNYTLSAHKFSFIATQDNTGQIPDFSGVFWESVLSSFIKKNYIKSIKQGYEFFLQKLFSEQDIKEYSASQFLFQESGKTYVDYIGTGLCGYDFKLHEHQNCIVKFSKISFLPTLSGDFILSLWHSSQSAPIQTRTITVAPLDVGVYTFYSFDALELTNKNLNTSAGGVWKITLENAVGSVQKALSLSGQKWPNYWFSAFNETTTLDFYDFDTFLTSSGNIPFNIQFVAGCNYAYDLDQNVTIYKKYFDVCFCLYMMQIFKFSLVKSDLKSKFEKEYEGIVYGLFQENGKPVSEGLLQIKNKMEKSLSLSLKELDPVCYKTNKPMQIF